MRYLTVICLVTVFAKSFPSIVPGRYSARESSPATEHVQTLPHNHQVDLSAKDIYLECNSTLITKGHWYDPVAVCEEVAAGFIKCRIRCLYESQFGESIKVCKSKCQGKADGRIEALVAARIKVDESVDTSKIVAHGGTLYLQCQERLRKDDIWGLPPVICYRVVRSYFSCFYAKCSTKAQDSLLACSVSCEASAWDKNGLFLPPSVPSTSTTTIPATSQDTMIPDGMHDGL
jgi:hypothetical protein